MNCLEHKEAPWFKRWTTPREHKCKVLGASAYENIYGNFSHTAVNYQCVDCLELRLETTFIRKEAILKAEFIKVTWRGDSSGTIRNMPVEVTLVYGQTLRCGIIPRSRMPTMKPDVLQLN